MRRLNKYITDAGYCSRREADRYIEQGRVTVNGREAALGDMVGDADLVEVDGERVGRRRKPPVYIACNKPVGVTCTSERSDKTNIIDFLGYKERIFPVGRLDKDSEGLILLTNDGDIVNKILRAGNNNPKEYIVTVDKPITQEFLDRMGSGVRILGVVTKPCRIYRTKDTTFVIHLTQGLNRQIRRMCQALDYKVLRLKRVRVLNITLGSLEPGRWRYLTPEEAREMHTLLATSSGTEEASNEKKAARAKSGSRRNSPTGGTGKPSQRENRTSVQGGGQKPRDERKPREGGKISAGKSTTASRTASTSVKKSGTYSDYRRGGKAGKPSSGSGAATLSKKRVKK